MDTLIPRSPDGGSEVMSDAAYIHIHCVSLITIDDHKKSYVGFSDKPLLNPCDGPQGVSTYKLGPYFATPITRVTSRGCKVYSAFLDASKAFDKVLHNGLYKKLSDRKAPLCFVLLLINWYSKLHCAVRWNGFMGEWFPIQCGVRQGGVLSPYLFSVYVSDLIFELRNSGSGAHIGKLFMGCVLYADDIVLMSPSCHGLQRLVRICEKYGLKWDIKFNPCKSQVITFGGSTAT